MPARRMTSAHRAICVSRRPANSDAPTDPGLDAGGAKLASNGLVVERAPDLPMQPVDHLARRPRRGEHRIGGRRIEVAEAALLDGRDIRQVRGALTSGDRKRPQLTGIHLFEPRRDRGDPELDAAGQEVGRALAAHPIRNMDRLDADELREQLAVEVARRAVAGRAEHELAGLLSRQRDELPDRSGPAAN